jgi:hypothetical protein
MTGKMKVLPAPLIWTDPAGSCVDEADWVETGVAADALQALNITDRTVSTTNTNEVFLSISNFS